MQLATECGPTNKADAVVPTTVSYAVPKIARAEAGAAVRLHVGNGAAAGRGQDFGGRGSSAAAIKTLCWRRPELWTARGARGEGPEAGLVPASRRARRRRKWWRRSQVAREELEPARVDGLTYHRGEAPHRPQPRKAHSTAPSRSLWTASGRCRSVPDSAETRPYFYFEYNI